MDWLWNVGRSAGDVDGDGYDDVIIGWPGYFLPLAAEGIANIYSGSSEGLVITPTWSYKNDIVESNLGSPVAGVGDVNGDGFDDVMVAGLKYANPDPFEGIVYLFLGSATGPSTEPDWQREGDQPFGQLGWDIQSAGDVNADGFSDVLIGSPFYDHGEDNEGMGWLYFGSSAGLLPEPVYTVEGNVENVNLGWSLDTAGDVNGDGNDDIIVGTRYHVVGNSNPGKADVFYGRNDAAARILLPLVVR
jgi:hypothetical protein